MAGHCIRHPELLASDLVLWEPMHGRAQLDTRCNPFDRAPAGRPAGRRARFACTRGIQRVAKHSKADQDKATCLCY